MAWNAAPPPAIRGSRLREPLVRSYAWDRFRSWPSSNKNPSCGARDLWAGRVREPSTGSRGQLSGSYRFLTIGLRDKVAVDSGREARQSGREGRDKVAVDKSSHAQLCAQGARQSDRAQVIEKTEFSLGARGTAPSGRPLGRQKRQWPGRDRGAAVPEDHALLAEIELGVRVVLVHDLQRVAVDAAKIA